MASSSSRTPRNATSSHSVNGSRTPQSSASSGPEPNVNGEKHDRRGLGEGLEGDEYIARIRYDNALPPPPCPPKLLRIPGEGIPDHYLSPGFTSRLARQQEPNIELDAFLGMPIDILGMPGAMEGDMRSIEFPEEPPDLDPVDQLLLKASSSLGKAKQAASGAGFLRRLDHTEGAGRSRHDLGFVRKDNSKTKASSYRNNAQTQTRDDDPTRVTEDIEQGFMLANMVDYEDSETNRMLRPADRDAWEHPKHPMDPRLTVVDSYPLLMDPDTTPETGAYFVAKFKNNPGPDSESYDARLDDGILRPLPMKPEYVKEMEAKRVAHQVDPTQPDPGQPKFDYEFFLADDDTVLDAYRPKSRLGDTRQQDLDIAETGEGERETHGFHRIRTYETYQQTGDGEDFYSDSIAISLHDSGGDSALPKGAYYYPVSHRSHLRPRRLATAGPVGLPPAAGADGDQVDRLEVYVVSAKPQADGVADEDAGAMET